MAKKIVKLTEKDIHNIVKECINNYKPSLLTEDRESKNMKRARNVVRQFQPNADAMQIITAIRNDIPNSRINQCEYLPGVTRMFMNGELNDGRIISQINASLKLLGNAHANEYNNDLNGMSAENLVNKFSTEVQGDLQSDIDAHNREKFTPNNDYTIVRIESTEEAWPYNKYTDWCITSSEPGENYNEDDWTDEDGYEDEDAFDPSEAPDQTSGYDMYQSYTNGGLGLFYFILKNGFEKVPKEVGEGCPLDEYGLSMIATSVDENGKCNTITCRWNHKNGGNDEIMTPMQLSKIIGRNYYEVFKPYSEDERKAKGLITFDEAEQLLANGISWRQLFKKDIKSCKNGLIIVNLNEKQNFVNPNTNQLISKQWFYSVNEFSDGLAPVSIDYGKSNYIKEDGTLLFDNYFNGVAYPFKNGVGKIRIMGQNGGYHFIDTNGNYTNSTPINGSYSDIIPIGNFLLGKGYSEQKLYTKNGEELFQGLNLKNVDNERDGYVRITVQTDKLKPEESRYRIYDSEYEEVYGLVQPNGTLFLGKLFNSIHKSNNIVKVENDDGKVGLFTLNEKLICNMWFDEVDAFYSDENVTKVVLNNKVNYLNYRENKLLLKQWAEKGTDCWDHVFAVELTGKWYVMHDDMTPVTNEYFDSISKIQYSGWSRGLFPAKVEKNGKFSVLDENGNLLKYWFDKIETVFGRIIGYDNDNEYVVNLKNQTIQPYTKEQRRKDKEEDDYMRWERRQEYY